MDKHTEFLALRVDPDCAATETPGKTAASRRRRVWWVWLPSKPFQIYKGKQAEPLHDALNKAIENLETVGMKICADDAKVTKYKEIVDVSSAVLTVLFSTSRRAK